MSNLFHIAEVLDMGIDKEKKRRDFYAKVADNFKDKEIRNLFMQLRDWEKAHVAKFTQIRNEISDAETPESFPGELELYMNGLVDDKLYRDVSAELFSSKISSPLNAIDCGLQFERDAILFFSEFWRYVPDESKQVVEELIGEERKHVVFLVALREKYK